MKKLVTPFLLFVILMFLAACTSPSTGSPVASTPTVTPNIQATVDAGVQGTQSAEQAVQATVQVAVEATVSSLPPTSTPAPTAEVTQLTEEELSALIDEAVNDAIDASEATSTATTQAASDGTITEEEIAYIYDYYYWADEALYYAEYLIEEYYGYYGEYADDAVTVMLEMEEDLESISSDMAAIEEILVQGSEAATAAIQQLNEAATQAQTNLGTVQGNIEGWTSVVQQNLDVRAENALNMSPTEIAGDLDGTINQMHDFLDAVKGGLLDNKITPDELQNISQLAANAQASLGQFGTPRLKEKSANITNLTEQLARGQLPQAQLSVPEFERDLPERPSR